jgi:hypothetical protein
MVHAGMAAARPGNTNAVPVLLFLLLRRTGYRWLAGGCYCSQSYQVHACTHGKNDDDDTYAHKTKAALSILLPPPNSVTACMLCLLLPSKPGP